MPAMEVGRIFGFHVLVSKCWEFFFGCCLSGWSHFCIQGLYSLLSFSWVSDLMRRGNRPPPIDIPHMLPAPGDMRAADLARELSASLIEREWQARKDGHQVKLDHKELAKSLLWLHRWRLLRTGFLRFLNTAVQFLPALILGPLLTAIKLGDVPAGQTAALQLFAVLCLKTFVENQFFYQTTMMATRVQSMLQASIYEKSLRLHEAAAVVPPVTLMQVDTSKVADLTYSLHTLWDGIFQVVGYSVLLWWYLGVAGFAGIVVMLIGLPFNAQLQRDLSSLMKKCLETSDARVSKTSEILGGIRALRQMGWEDIFELQVRNLRDQELRQASSIFLSKNVCQPQPIRITIVCIELYTSNINIYSYILHTDIIILLCILSRDDSKCIFEGFQTYIKTFTR